jgi:hypothetical protein
MKKRTVGICANYDASEQCLCALFLAGYIVTRYRYATWFTPSEVKPSDLVRGFSHQWDNTVCHPEKPKYKAKAKVCDTLFFFEPDNDLFDLLPPGAVTAFVLNPYTWDKKAKDFAKRCSRVLLLSSEWVKTYSKYPYLRNFSVWPFEPSLHGISRQNIDKKEGTYLFYPAYGFSPIDRQFVCNVAELVNYCRPDIKSVVGFYREGVPPRPGYDPRVFDWRLQKYLQNSDWVIDLNPKPLFGFFPACAGNYGLRWAGFNISPYNDAHSQTRRHLITTETKPVGSNAVKAAPDLEATAVQIVKYIEDVERNAPNTPYISGSWERRCSEFLQTTNHILGIRTRY